MSSPSRWEAKTHDLTHDDYSFRPLDDGQRGHITCWNALFDRRKPEPGDYVILRNGSGTTRYRIVTVNPCLNVEPPTMWMADLVFAPRCASVK